MYFYYSPYTKLDSLLQSDNKNTLYVMLLHSEIFTLEKISNLTPSVLIKIALNAFAITKQKKLHVFLYSFKVTFNCYPL